MNRYIFLLLLVPYILIASTNSRALYIKKYKNESKTALIIGNGTYGYFSNLNNAINDAKDMKNILESKGFKVHYLRDATLRQMDKMIDRFANDLKKGGVGLAYFAGHGVEVDGKNYLIPVDTELRDKSDLKYDAFPVDKLIDRMENAKNRLSILVLDACRNDPFSRSGGGGLAAINNAKGMYVAYATAPGEVASDGGASKNGLFTKYLIKEIKKPQPLESVFKNTRVAVMKESKEKQLPWTSSSVMGEFYFTVPVLKYQNSIVSFNEQKQKFYSLTINTQPSDATVQITNIKPKYYDGIKLKPNKYSIKVFKNGYITKTGIIKLNSNLNTMITLQSNRTTLNIKADEYVKPKDNVWRDPDTNKLWQLKTNKKLYTWNEAKRYCETLTLDGIKGWRIPNPGEVESINTETGFYTKYAKNAQKIYIKEVFKDDMEFYVIPYFWTSFSRPLASFGSYINYFIDNKKVFGTKIGSPLKGTTKDNKMFVRCINGEENFNDKYQIW